MAGFFARLKEGLSRTRENVTGRLGELVGRYPALGEEFYEELEEVLLGADAGVETAERLVEGVRRRARQERLDAGGVLQALQEEARSLLGEPQPLRLEGKPAVVLLVGVNGSGKTTTAGKLAVRFRAEGRRVLLAAGDTFRAAAAEQLAIWGERAGAEVIRQGEGSDPAAVAFDAVQAARARGTDVLIVDTAGRLQTRSNLMQELEKVRRVLARELPGQPAETLLVLDATTGQNALSQARIFHQAVGVTGLVLTKLDGTARGGVVLAVRSALELPVKLVGVGERPEDLQDFAPDDFVRALFEAGQAPGGR